MDDGIGEGLTREDHGDVSNQMYAAYAEGENLRNLVNIVGREALSERDNKYLDFADAFEGEFVQQGYNTNRSIDDTLDLGWDLLSELPKPSSIVSTRISSPTIIGKAKAKLSKQLLTK
jgi:V/A-type H+-transporting ATPase subunit B